MRKANVKRKTNETDISINLTLDGSGANKISTGIPFFDHMLTSFSKHSKIEIELKATGDIDVDFHHTIEDTGIVLGKALNEALSDKKGIARFGDAGVCMDEALARVTLDLSGRAFLSFNIDFPRTDDGNNLNPYLFEEFFRGLVNSLNMTMHIDLVRGNNSHHILEAVFKAFALALKRAVKITNTEIPSTKGVL